MPKENCQDLLLSTAIWSFCSASSHAQLLETICVSHSLLRHPCRVFTFTGTDMIKIPPKHFLLHCFRMCCSREKPQTSIALHCFAVLWASTWAWHVAVWQSRRRGQPRRVQPLSHTGQQNPDPDTHACDMSRHRLIWRYSTPPIYCTWPTT